MFPHKENKIKRNFSPIYLAIFSGIILIILIINGLLEINRTKNGFYRLLEREAIVLIQHFEKNIQETLTSLQLMESVPGRQLLSRPISGFFFDLEESVAEYLVEAAQRVDQIDKEKPLMPPISNLLLTSISSPRSKSMTPKGTSSGVGLLQFLLMKEGHF